MVQSTIDYGANRSFPKVPDQIKAELLRIGGTNDYGEPKLQLVWGEEREWFRAGKIRLKYPTSRKNRKLIGYNVKNLETGREWFQEQAMPDSRDVLVMPVYRDFDIGYPGWVLEEWWPPELVCDGWEQMRWYIEAHPITGQIIRKIDLMGPPPIRGDFRFLMYCEDENDKPMNITDHRLIEIIEKAIKLRNDEGAADGWRTMQSPEKAMQLQKRIQEDRDKADGAIVEERNEFIDDLVKGYARKMRHAYLS